MRTIVYADGGCDPNPGPGGWGVVIQASDGPIDLCGGERVSTNNRMELTAAIRALEHFPAGAAIEMRCDSQYVVKSVTEWMPGWKRRGWRTASGPVKNQDLMERLDELARARDVRWTWVRGHAGEDGNERADRLATRGRREALGLPIRADAGTRRSETAKEAAGPRRTSIAIDAELADGLARAAERAGTTLQSFVEDILRRALKTTAADLARMPAAETLERAPGRKKAS